MEKTVLQIVRKTALVIEQDYIANGWKILLQLIEKSGFWIDFITDSGENRIAGSDKNCTSGGERSISSW